MRRSVILGFVVVALIAFVLWAIGSFVQPFLPKDINTHAILFLAILTSTIAAVAGFKDIIELLTLLRTKTVENGDGRVQHNLPQHDFERFIGRSRELEEIHGLLAPKTRHFVITIDGVGGVGKTALALQVASSYVRTPQLRPRSHRFSAVIWITAKKDALSAEGIVPRHQRLHVLEDIFATVATVLNRRDVVSTPTDHQDEMVRHALTKHRTLVIIDNLETVDDDRIMSFVKEVPAPTKVIVTTRHRIDVAYPIRLRGMSVSEASQLIQDEETKKGVKLTGSQVEKLIARTGGVPLAIVWSIAQMALGHPPEHVLTRLGSQNNDISRFCFDAVIEMLRGKPEYTLLLALAYLGNNIDRETLGTTAGLPTLDRDDGLIVLEKLSLVNKDNAIFTMLPLTLAYCLGELENHPDIVAKLSVSSLSNYRRNLVTLFGRNNSHGWSKPLPQEGLINSRILSKEGMVYDDLRAALVHHPRILLIGPPGVGKTTALRKLAVESAIDESSLPIYIPLLNYADTGLEIIDLVAQQFRSVGITNERERVIEVLRSGRAMMLLDAVDEVPDTPERERLLEQVRRLCVEHPLSSWVITSRFPLNATELQGFSVLTVGELSDTQIERFVRLWYGKDSSNATRLLSSIRDAANPAIGALARNPLLLSIICSTFDEQRTLPRSSAKLLESATNVVLRKWDSARYVHHSADAGALTTTASLRLLQEIAFQTFSDGHHVFPRSDVERIIRHFIQDRPDVRLFDASEVLATLVAQGMLREDGGWFSFLHISFHEYLTASYFAESPHASLLADHANDDRWSEVISLYQELVRDRTGRATVLFIAADTVSASPHGRLQLDEDVRHIREKVRAAQYRNALVFEFRLAVRADDLIQALNETSPQVVHFSGHGSSEGLVLVGRDGGAHLMSAPALEDLFRVFRRDIRVVILNACFSLPQAQAIAAVVGCAIGTVREISDKAAVTFSASFYRALAFGSSVQTAFDQARVALTLEHPGEEETAHIIAGPGVDPARIFVVRGKD